MHDGYTMTLPPFISVKTCAKLEHKQIMGQAHRQGLVSSTKCGGSREY
jgi:hypothetical protein